MGEADGQRALEKLARELDEGSFPTQSSARWH